MSKVNGKRIAFIDIETSPNLGWVWGKWEQDVIKNVREWRILAFSVKYLGEKKVQVYGLDDFPSAYKKDKMDDRLLVTKLRDVLDGADIVVAHNGDQFDIKKSNARFIAHGLTPPSPYKTIDTKKVAKRYFKFDSNKLADLAMYLGLPHKMETGGFGLWEGCMNGDKKAWKKMKQYNVQDVIVLEALYLAFRPWMAVHPNMNIYDKGHSCPKCESKNLQSRGISMTMTGGKQRYQCQDCGAWSLGKNIKTAVRVSVT